MIQTVEAVIEEDGTVRLLEAIRLTSAHRALVTILEEASEAEITNPAFAGTAETALLSESALEDWNRPEEEAAWSYLQQGTSS